MKVAKGTGLLLKTRKEVNAKEAVTKSIERRLVDLAESEMTIEYYREKKEEVDGLIDSLSKYDKYKETGKLSKEKKIDLLVYLASLIMILKAEETRSIITKAFVLLPKLKLF